MELVYIDIFYVNAPVGDDFGGVTNEKNKHYCSCFQY